ncbi:MAG: glycosyltransferase family 4 protein [Candidatus Poribacteria bacterium]
MKILLVLTKKFTAGGGQSHIINLSKGLIAEGHEVIVAADSGPLINELRTSGAEFYRLRFCTSINLLGLIVQILIAVMRLKPEIIHAQSGNAMTACLPVSKLFGTPCVVTYHGFSPQTYNDKTVSALVPKIITVSEYYKNKLLQGGHLKPEQIAVIPNGLDFEKYSSPLPDKPEENISVLEIETKADKIIYISRLSKEKAGLYDKSKQIAQVLGAMPLVYKEIPSARLLIVGGGDAFDETKNQAEIINRELGVDLISLAGVRYDIPNIIRQGDVVLGLGQVVLEGLACEQATISLQNGAFGGPMTPEKVETLEKTNFAGMGGRDSPILAEDIITVLKNREYYLALAKKAKDRAKVIADIQSIARRTVEVYREVIREHRVFRQPAISTALLALAMLGYKMIQYLGKERLK